MTIVNKLGGSCLRNVADFQKVHHILTKMPSILVVSATYGTTQQLLTCLNLACECKNDVALNASMDPVVKPREVGGKLNCQQVLDAIIEKHLHLNHELTQDKIIEQHLLQDKEDIQALLHSIAMLKSYSLEQKEWVLGYGEYWSSRILAAMLNAPFVDAGDIITVRTHESVAEVLWDETANRFQQQHVKAPLVIMPGFVARTELGHRTLLGFNGSDYSAAIIAKLINASDFYKWTDIDGIYTANPKLVQSAFPIKELSYQEAAELAYFGASVLHPQSVQPVVDANIPIHIRNYFKEEGEGTTVCAKPAKSDLIIKGLSSISDVAIINIEGLGLVGVCGFASRVFHALSKASISVILISQASSEHSICLVVKAIDGLSAVGVIKQELHYELQSHLVENISLITQCAVISAVGENMSGTPGVAARFFEMLFKANINILAIAQGSSERNISVVIQQEATSKALCVLHGGFYLSQKSVSIGLIGPGGVGSTLLEQIKLNAHRLKEELNVDLQIRGIMTSQSMVLSDKTNLNQDWQKCLQHKSVVKDLQGFIQHIASPEIPHALIIDCTSSAAIAHDYPKMIEYGCHLVTPNKKANSAEMRVYKKLKQTVKAYNRHYLYEATVCAGLPVIKTIQDLLVTGDEIKRIEGIVSGTLSYIFNQCAQGVSFADSVKQAYELGFTEPDPRDDLNGLDVARKFVCLARELNYELSLSDVSLLSMVPDAIKDLSIPDFLKELHNHQGPIEVTIKKLLASHKAVAYVGVIEKGQVSIALKGYPASHPFAHTTGTDNILLIQSVRYDKQPLIIQGPGAGRDVTAAGVFADLLKLVSML
jgi:aspartokinase/homoserine dehydrogenase 1